MILHFKPVLKEKLWGGTRLLSWYDAKDKPNVGEAWGISAHREGESVVTNGIHKGKTLSELWNTNKAIFGYHPSDEFPVLIKIIDAAKDLSIQVHPDNEMAKQYGSLGKSECWTILDCKENQDMIIGHNANSKDEFIHYVQNSNFLSLVHNIKIKPMDQFFIPAGTLHAICAGTMLLEVQQSSDLTFRFYDYNRLQNGKPRELHIEEAINAVTIPNKRVIRDLTNPYFSLILNDIHTNTFFYSGKYGTALVALSGEGTIDDKPFKQGDFYFVSSDTKYEINGDLTIAFVHIK